MLQKGSWPHCYEVSLCDPAASGSSLKICYKAGKQTSPNQIYTDDAQITFFPTQINRRKYFYPCLLTDSSQMPRS